MSGSVPREADRDRAPGLLDGAMGLELTPREANLRYWLAAVPHGTLRGWLDGHPPDVAVPDLMRRGPLYDAITREYAFRAVAEEKAARALSYLVPLAPDTDTMEFYATQVLDEARHAMVFRNHLVTLGVPAERLRPVIDEVAGGDVRSILLPLEEFALDVMRDRADFLGGVVVMTVILEGALAPAAELSERKWRPLDPAAADIDRGAGIDEIRHLTVGAAVARQYLLEHPERKPDVLDLIRRGMRLWARLPVRDMVARREELFQRGLERHAEVVGDYEIWPGRRLVDTTPEERQGRAEGWSAEMKEIRLKYMGLEEAL
ncbi:MAG TPA: VlmB-like protein [Actinophytocola sp.]|uniref:VlmB-like protein n=1 Tax=Actinophytocola sp. TaxID=1872138 RepID=UPI002DDD6F76|nr:VlmB-like protein [Actinophytocola sp.]HEV2779909.1 VlmB-like protein [Actinophytocola sp.]